MTTTTSTVRIIACFLFGLLPSNIRAEISRPAGEMPVHRGPAVSGGLSAAETAKSKLIPVTRTKVTIKPTANIARAGSSPQKSLDEAVESGGQTWDSVSRRLTESDPARDLTGGVRVEDIVEPSSDYQYSASRRRNPFLPDVARTRSLGQRELSPNDVEIPIINPLQSFELRQLAVIGVWEGSDHVWKALIQTPTNQGIETKLGDPAGNSGGRIMSISTDAVIVREFKVRTDGTREYHDVPLYMGSDKPRDDDQIIGGRLILKPGATEAEIERPEIDSTAAITAPAEAVATDEAGTLKSRAKFQPADTKQLSDQDATQKSEAAPKNAVLDVVSPKDALNGTVPVPAVQGGFQ